MIGRDLFVLVSQRHLCNRVGTDGSQATEAIRFTFIRTIWKHPECNQSI